MRWHSQIQGSGIPLIRSFEQTGFETIQLLRPKKPAQMLTEFHKFFLRWRLDAMAAPYLPIPLQSQGPLLAEKPKNAPADVGTLFYFSDVLPLPLENELRTWVEDALRSSAPEYLKEWNQIVSSGNSAKNKLKSFARRFALQLSGGCCTCDTRQISRARKPNWNVHSPTISRSTTARFTPI